MVLVVVVAVVVVYLSICLSASLKTKHFCETPSVLELDNVENETILREVLQKRKVECRADGLVPMRFAIFPFHLSKVLHLPRKIDARSYEVLHLSCRITFPKLKILCSKMQPLSGNQRPDLLTSLMNMSLVLHFCDFPTFSRTWIFFLLRLSLFDRLSSFLLFSSLLFSSHFSSLPFFSLL